MIWSELGSNQPFGFFRPALIPLSYPTQTISVLRFQIEDWSLVFGLWLLAFDAGAPAPARVVHVEDLVQRPKTLSVHVPLAREHLDRHAYP
jgi:hypothetical protein